MSEGCEVCVTVRVATIRDGTHGVSISIPDRLIGEWTDSGARSLTVTDENHVCVRGSDSAQRYLLAMPGTPLRCEQASDCEATIVVNM